MVVSRLLLSIFFYNYCFILAVSSEPNRSNLSRLSPGLSTVEGPGVDGKRQPLPMEYFYVQLMNEGGEKFKGAIDESLLTIDFISSPESRVFVNKKIHYLREGLFAVRYRLHREVASLSISVKYNNQHIGDSPYTIGKALVDKCFCPERTVKQWLKDFKCPSSYRQVDDSLALYKSKGIKLSQLPVRLANEFSNTHGIHYSIVNNKLYGKTFGTITDFRAMSDMILTSMLNKAQLPDMEFIVQVSDWPQDKNDPKKEPFPFFSWCGSEYYRDIVWPQYDLMRHTVQAMDRVELDMMWLQQGLSLPWSERIPKAFFRGRDSNKVRLDFVSKYRKKTDLFNVTLTQFFFHPHDEELYGKMVKRISFIEFFKYKYQINIDGTVAAYRFPFLMAGGSLIFKQDSQYYEHFYHQTEPWKHYVPLKEDVSDIEEKLKWALEHEKEAQQIAENAYNFAVNNLLPDHLFCYMYTLFNEYAKLQQGKVRIHKGMTEVTTDESHWANSCQLCSINKSKKVEL